MIDETQDPLGILGPQKSEDPLNILSGKKKANSSPVSSAGTEDGSQSASASTSSQDARIREIAKIFHEKASKPAIDNTAAPKLKEAPKKAAVQQEVSTQDKYVASAMQRIGVTEAVEKKQQREEALKEEERKKAQFEADQLYETPAGKLYFNILQPLASAGARGVANTASGIVRTIGDIAGEEEGVNKVADRIYDFISPEKRWDGTIAAATPKKLQGNLFNDGKLNASKIIPSTVKTLADMAFLVGPTVAGGGTGTLMASSYVQSLQDYRNAGKEAGLSGTQLDDFARQSSLLTSLLETISPNKSLTGSLKGQLAKTYAEQIAKGVTVKTAMKQAAKEFTKEIGKENLQELSQLAGDKLVRYVTDRSLEKPVFNDDISFKGLEDEVKSTLLMTTLATGLLNSPKAIADSRPDNFTKAVLYEAAKDPTAFNTALDKQLQEGKLTEEQVATAKNNLDKYRGAAQKVSTIGVSPDQEIDIAFDTFKANELKQESEAVKNDPALNQAIGPEIKKKEDEIITDIKKTGMGIPKIGDEVTGEDLSNILTNIGDKGGDATSLISKVKDGSYRVEEVDLKKLFNEDESFRQYVEEFKSPKQKDTDGLLFPAIISNNKVIDGRSRLAEQYLSGQEKAVVFKQLEDDIKEEPTVIPETLNTNTNEKERQESEVLAPKTLEEELREELGAARMADPKTLEQELRDELSVVKDVEQSLKNVGVKVVTIPSDEFGEIAKKMGGKGTERAFFDDVAGEIVLREGVSNDLDVLHEGAHPAMNILYNTDRELYDQVVQGMKQVDNEGVKAALAFAAQYKGQEVQDNEAIVEVIARIGSGEINVDSIPTSFKQKLIDLINRLAKFLGIEIADTDVGAFKKMAASVADALRTGKDITEVVGEGPIDNNVGLEQVADTDVQFAKQRIEQTQAFKLASFVMRKKAEGAPTVELVTSIASVVPTMSPQEVKELVDDPAAYLRKSISHLSEALQQNIIARAGAQNIYSGRPSKPVSEAYEGISIDEIKIRERNRLKNWVQQLRDAATSFKNKQFDAARGLPSWLLDIKDQARGSKDLEVARARKTVMQLRDEAKKIGFKDWDAFSEALVSLQPKIDAENNNTAIQQYYANLAAQNVSIIQEAPALLPAEIKAIPAPIRPYVYQMRNHIDSLTKDLILGGYVTPEQAVTLERNLGAYTNRAYKLFTEKGYTPSKDAIAGAVKYFADQYLPEIMNDNAGVVSFDEAVEMAITKAEREVNDILAKKRSPLFGKKDGRDVGVLKEKKDVPPALRALYGEYTDPGIVYTMTIAKQAALKASSKYLSELRRMGMGNLFFEAEDPNRPTDYNVKIAADNGELLAPLNGLYTSEEIAEALEEVTPHYNDIVSKWMKLVAAIRWSKTVASPKTQVMNFESGALFALLQGQWFTGRAAKSLKGAASYAKDRYSKKEMNDITEKVISLGLVNQNVNAADLQRLFTSGDIHDVALDMNLSGRSMQSKVWRGITRPVKELNTLYSLSDDYWKTFSYLNERESVAKALFDKKYSELNEQEERDVDIETAERVKDTQPTYSRILPIVRGIMRNVPIVGNFLGFRAEALRVLGNSVRIAVNDMKNPNTKAMGVRRMAGIISYVAAQAAVDYAKLSLLGIGVSGLLGLLINDEDEESRKRGIKAAVPDFLRTNRLGVEQNKKEPHKYTVYSYSQIDPYNVLFNSFVAATDGRKTFTGQTIDGPAAFATELVGGFLDPEMTFRTLYDVMNNKDKDGNKIFKESDSNVDQIVQGASYIWNELQPSAIGMAERMRKEGGFEREMEGLLFGLKPYEVDLHKAYSYALTAMMKNIEEANGRYNRVVYKKDVTPEEKAKAKEQLQLEIEYQIEKNQLLKNDFLLLGADKRILDRMIRRRPEKVKTGLTREMKKRLKDGE